MSLVPCKECGEQISSTAKNCPKCGAKVPHFKWWLWVPVGLVIAFFAFGWVVGPHSPQDAYDKTYSRCLREQGNKVLIGNMSVSEFCGVLAETAKRTYR